MLDFSINQLPFEVVVAQQTLIQQIYNQQTQMQMQFQSGGQQPVVQPDIQGGE